MRLIAGAPLFRDPIFDAPTDPVVIWNNEESCWWMLYTQRRHSVGSVGVAHIHGSKIGIASSDDGSNWLYRGTLPGLDIEPGHNTFWAPEVIFADGLYHMYLSYIQGVPTNWNRERHILHFTADNLWNWAFKSKLELSSNRVIDACVYEIAPSVFKMWYKDEVNNSHSYAAISSDLYNWEVVGPEITFNSHEGANVFELSGKKWLITDEWRGLGVYFSDDFSNWHRQGNIMFEGGIRDFDGVMASHPDVVVTPSGAYIFYFTHYNWKNENRLDKSYIPRDADNKTCIQVAELKVVDGVLVCERDEFEFEMRGLDE